MVKSTIKRVVGALGYDLRRRTPEHNPLHGLVQALTYHRVDLVLDVGANAGQFAAGLRSAGFAGRIVSFEPLEQAYAQLVMRAAGDENWVVHERGALGAQCGEVSINVAGNSVSSSILPMMDAHSSVATNSSYVGVQRVPLFTLDSIEERYLSGVARPFLKVDAQGFEGPVLDGAVSSLRRMCGVMCEMSLLPLYEGQVLWLEMIQRLESAGLELWSLRPGFSDRVKGRTLQIDASFFRRNDAAGDRSDS